MNSDFKIKINSMNILSVSEFSRFRGRYANNEKSVIFLRLLGGYPSLSSDICKMDSFLCSGNDDFSAYLRIKNLPVPEDEDIKFYSDSYLSYKSNKGKICLKNAVKEQMHCNLEKAYQKILDLYKKTGKIITDTIERNIYVMMMFRFDFIMSRLTVQWNENSIVKIVSENITGIHNYLFFYLLVLMGIDVLLIQCEKDIDDKLKALDLSQSVVVGQTGRYEIKPFSPQQTESESRKSISETSLTDTIKKTHEVSHGKFLSIQAEQINKQEKSVEELAKLASAVVLIAVHDKNGNITGNGSGIMIGEKGFILTNCHVASKGFFFTVKIEDDDNLYTTNEIIKYNNVSDLAVIRIDRCLCPIPVYSGTRPARGQKVVAIGSPLGLFNTVSDGIISGFREINSTDMIQFTAPISPGSSGGALLNMNGEVIGIITAGFDVGQNINLAVSYECINSFIKGLV